ncbi:MAG: cobalamin-dependent protein [Deltaproteobacteria bacterium]|nr:cobalamin-dependent protein [Deltaproteobacteria bacterium]
MPTPRVLMSSVAAPLGPRHGDGVAVGYELLHAQVTRAQGVFSPRAVHVQYGIDYIAANLDTPVTTLHYPSERDFVRELQTGGYTHVGISFNLSTSHRMRRMSQLVRRHAPDATIVLGGYGTIQPDEELAKHGDVWCRGEGVAFMRDLLGEPVKMPPFNHPLSVSTLKVMGLPFSQTGLVFGGLGCVNGCDFCTTSHYFHRRHIKLLPTGRDVFEVLQAYRELDPDMEFTVLDEDFLLDRRRAMELRELVMAHEMRLDLFVFASVRALSMYTPQELVEIGVGGVWVGYEGTRAGYKKQQGRPIDELFADLRRHGILILASMIVGLDYQTPEIVRAELDGLLALRPTLSQFLIYGPTPGTPLGDRIEAEGRWRPDLRDDPERRWRLSDGFTCLVTHPHMAPEEIEALQRWCYTEDYRRLGPAILRSVETWQTGYEHLKGSPIPAFSRRAEYLARKGAVGAALIPIARALAPSAEVRRDLGDLNRRLRAIAPLGVRAKVALLGAASFPAAAIAAMARKLDVNQDPRPVRSDWASADHPPVVTLARPEVTQAVSGGEAA